MNNLILALVSFFISQAALAETAVVPYTGASQAQPKLGTKKAKPALDQHKTKSKTTSKLGSQNNCPKNCHEAGVKLQHIHDLRVQIEDEQNRLSPSYKKKIINPVNISQFQGTCDSTCPQIIGIEKQVQKYTKQLADLKAKKPAAPANQSMALVPYTGGEKPTPPNKPAQPSCPKNCYEAGVKLQHIHDLLVQIEDERFRLNPSYQKKSVNLVNTSQFQGTCGSTCPQIIGIEKQVQKYTKQLADLKAKKPAAPANQSMALVPYTGGNATDNPKNQTASPQSDQTCASNCVLEGQMLKQIAKYQNQIEQEKHRIDASYIMKSIPPVSMSTYTASCHPDCPKVIALRKKHSDLRGQLNKLKEQPTKSKNTGVDQTQAGQCPKNCHEAYQLLQQIYQTRVDIEKAKHSQNRNYKMKQIKAPTMADSQQHCTDSCPQVIGITKQLDKYQAELSSVQANQPAPINNNQPTKRQCTPNCDNEVQLRMDIRQLNGKVEQLKHQANPGYRMKTFKAIDPSIAIGQQCPATCNNIKRLVTRKHQLEKQVSDLEQTGSTANQPVNTLASTGGQDASGGEFDETESGALVPYNESQVGKVAPKKKPGLFSRFKQKVKGAASSVKRKIAGSGSKKNPSTAVVPYKNEQPETAYEDESGSDSGAVIPYNEKQPGTIHDDEGDYGSGAMVPYKPKSPTPPKYNPYGDEDESAYDQGYGYNHATGNYGSDDYGYSGGSSITTHESSPPPLVTPPRASGPIFRSNTTDEGNSKSSEAGANAMAAFGGVLAGLFGGGQPVTAPSPAAVVPPSPYQPPSPYGRNSGYSSQHNSSNPSNFKPDSTDLDDIYGGNDSDAADDYADDDTDSYTNDYSNPYGSSSYGSGSSRRY